MVSGNLTQKPVLLFIPSNSPAKSSPPPKNMKELNGDCTAWHQFRHMDKSSITNGSMDSFDHGVISPLASPHGRDDGALGGGAEARRICHGDVLLMRKYGGEYRIT